MTPGRGQGDCNQRGSFGRISLRTSGEKPRSAPPNPGKIVFGHRHPAQTSMKKLPSEKLRAVFIQKEDQRAQNPPEFAPPGLSRSNGSHAQREGTSLGVFVPIWLVLPRFEATNLGVFDLCHLDLGFPGPATGVIWALRAQSWKKSPKMSSLGPLKVPGPKTESKKESKSTVFQLSLTLFRLRFRLLGPRGREAPGTHFRTLFPTLGAEVPK